MKRYLSKRLGIILLAGAVMLMALPACGGSASEAGPAPTATQTTAKATASPATTAAATATATPMPTPTPAQSTVLPSTPTVSTGGGALVAQGKLIFEKTAGGLGCAYCHGLDGRGKGPANVNAANIRSKNEGDVRAAIQGGVAMMSFIKLTDDEITAVVAYLQYLNEQP